MSAATGYFGLTNREPLLSLTWGYHNTALERNKHKYSSAKLCEMLKLHRRQKRMCRRGKGIAESLLEATRLAVIECQYQFKHERWNCSLGQYRQNILRRGFSETSFLYAISSAGLVHAFARACSKGVLDRCTCDESKHLENHKTWLWGGCGDNLRYGLKFTRKFLKRARKSGKDVRAKVNQHNSRVGIKVVKENVNTTCKCHGVSGSCTVKTCWLQLSPFSKIGRTLKNKYERAKKVLIQTNQATGKNLLVRRANAETNALNNEGRSPKRGNLLYMDESPSFCRRSRYTPGTTGRTCDKDRDCETMCCGRGYNVKHTTVVKACKCQVFWCCHVKCKQCLKNQEIYMCK
ncbi:hypothetical protein LOTGIDRAFT_180028 [Lottia gigantea]|uniref:Protein Wnt n=1 Tax=Lottia gigantea TaxID=225164 RepID=V4CP96_LOTGI|nr:hypothetical protein LOTGIDRAFT_180028 [Lottia gigantea]ESP04245.1 hypothetical protein LOTGIDRAFT_180028 [Lottia gigantea]